MKDILGLAMDGAQHKLVYNAFSFAVAAMGIGFVYFLISRSRVAPAYRSAVTMSAMICGIAAYHYWRIFSNLAEGQTWNEGYRYADWLLTVPLLVAELVVVSGIAKDRVKPITTRLVVAALLMIATGYPGETSSDTGTRTLWGIISSLFMLYIVYELFFGEVGKTLKGQSGAVGSKLNNLRYVLLFTWGVYPIAYILGDETSWLSTTLGLSPEGSTTAIQVGYSIADVLAKPGYGLLILSIALARSEAEGYRAA